MKNSTFLHTNQLPIDALLPELISTLQEKSNIVVIAPPGAGKTTRVPLALLDAPWLAGKKVLMLEPRRLAARAAARFMAQLLKETIGETVGYRVRNETRIGPRTRIEVITEGILTRMLQSDPSLENIGAIILDEFHERSLHADLGLAFALQSQAVLRPDLHILVMSATLEADPVAGLLGGAPVLVSEGRQFPVETVYLDETISGRMKDAVANAVQTALRLYEGDILVFLPGVREIRQVAAELQASAGEELMIAPLYGMLSHQEQDQALLPSTEGRRKIVLATSIAETSLTVEGVSIVIDSGYMRAPRYSPRTGMTRLETVRVSRAAADQRRGRAGRLKPGVCFRLWTRQEDERLLPRSRPEILETDLTPLALELAVWGVWDAGELAWLDQPPLAALSQAREILTELEALKDCRVTAHGRRMASAGIHPRLAHMILKAKEKRIGALACAIAAIINERDTFGQGRGLDVDIRHRLELLDVAAELRTVRREAELLRAHFDIREPLNNLDAAGRVLALAYPDRLAQRRHDGRYLLRNGRGAMLSQEQLLAREPYLVAAGIDDQGSDGRILMAAPITAEEIAEDFSEQVYVKPVVGWDRESQAVRARRQETLGAIVLVETPLTNPADELLIAAMLEGIAIEGLAMLPWTKTANQLVNRIRFMKNLECDWPDVSEEWLMANAAVWLAPFLAGITSRTKLQQLNLLQVMEGLLTWEQRRRLEEQAPTHLTVPSGQRIPVDYENAESPVLAVRLQEMFGLKETPRIGGGRIPLTLELLSPARRIVQVTRDLASFWRYGYFEVRKDLLGRYPKHYWPEDPLTASATHRTKAKM